MIGKLITGFKNLLPFLSAGLSGTLKMTAAIKLQTIALWEQAKAFLATPIGWISAVTMVVFGLAKGLKYLAESNDRARENLSNLASEYKENVDQIESLNDELTTTQDRINELKAQGTLTFTEASELAQLERENAALKDKIDLLKIANQEKQKDAITTFNSLVGIRKNADGSEQMNQVETLTFYTQYQGEKYADEYIDSINDQIKALEDLEAAGVTYENADEETQNNIKRIHKLIDVYKVAKGEGANLFSTVYNRAEWAEVNKSIQELANSGNLTAESLQGLYNQGGNTKDFIDYMLSLGTLDWEAILGNEEFKKLDTNVDGVLYEYELFDDKTGECKVSSDKFATALGLVANELNKVEEAAEDAETSFKSIAKTLSDGLDKLSNKKDILSEVKEELDGFGAISADNISKILERFADNEDVQKAVAYYLSGIGTAQQLYDVMAKGYQNDLKLQAQTLATQMQNDEKYYDALIKLHGGYLTVKVGQESVDLSKCKDLATAKLTIENKLIETFKENWKKYYKWSNDLSFANIDEKIKTLQLSLPKGIDNILLTEKGRTDLINKFIKTDPIGKFLGQERVWRAYDAWKDLKDMVADRNSAIRELEELSYGNFDTSGFNTTLSTDFDKDSGKTEAEKYFDELKYKLETNKITQEQYLKDLDWGYKHFYNKTADYLEDYAKYSQEVYDGFKDMYKEDLEAQKEAWEEKKDAVSEYYDNLREQIENAHDKEDYEKEQSEKRKEIFDLDMQIAELMRDGSEKAKARIAELEEERLKAEEELLDFETDKAREDELSRLEKEQEAEEKKIQDQIDTIDKELETIDEDIVSVRNAIINYAAKQGVTLDFAYASGTRSSVGGFGRINEKGIEMISAPDGNGNYIPMLPSSYVFSAKATEFLWKLATEHSLPQAMYNSIAKSIKTQSNTPSVNIAQPITITMGDVIIKGNADKQTVADIKKQQENTVRMVLQKIKELQK